MCTTGYGFLYHLSYNLPVAILMQYKLILRNLRCFCLIIKEFHSNLDFHIVPVLCKYGVYQFRVEIVPADRFKHISRYIVGNYITELIGDGYLENAQELEKLLAYQEDCLLYTSDAADEL